MLPHRPPSPRTPFLYLDQVGQCFRRWLGVAWDAGLKEEEWATEGVSLAVPGFPSDSSCSQAAGLHSETKQLPLPFILSERLW